MDDPTKIRCVTVAAQVDAGKTTLTDSLLKSDGIISQRDAGDKCATDTMKEEQERGITIKSMGVSVTHRDHLINIIDSPGHVDFSSEVTAAVRVTDAVIVLIDVIDGVMVQTENVVRQAISDKCRPMLVINKCDRVILGQRKEPEEIYDQFVENIAQVNGLLAEFESAELGDLTIDPLLGNVVFSSAYHQWGFRLEDMAKVYAPKLKKSIEDTRKFLWKKKNFCKYVITPIKTIYEKIEQGAIGDVIEMMKKIDVQHPAPSDSAGAKELTRLFLGSWIPAGPAVLDMVIDIAPSPVVAQKYRSDYLYTGHEEDDALRSMRACDKNGPLVLYISKMIPDKQNSRFFAFGRVFSGTVQTGQKIHIMEADYKPGEGKTRKASIQQVACVMAGKMTTMECVTAGNTVAVQGLDRAINKTATITESPDYYPLRDMKYLVAPVVQVALEPKSNKDLGKFTQALVKLKQSDPLLEYYIDKATKEHIIAGSGELHIEVSINQLRNDFAKDIPINVKDPVVKYHETIVSESPQCLAKSGNKHNRLFVVAEPLEEEMVQGLENGDIDPNSKDLKAQARELYANYGMNRDHFGTKRFWGTHKGNVLIDGTSSVAYMNESQGNTFPGFITGMNKGPLCGEPVRGIMFRIEDAKLHGDSVHRGADQLAPAMRRVSHSCIMRAGVRLAEPMFLASITVPKAYTGPVYTVVSRRRGDIVEETIAEGSTQCQIVCHLPVAESFGFDAELKQATSGRALPQCSFSHYKIISSDPMEEGSPANLLAVKIRERKGLQGFPVVSDFIERL